MFLNKAKDANGTANYTTSWIFAYGTPSERPAWTGLTPAMQIKGDSVVINKLLGSKVGASYNLDVNGTANATTIYENGTALSSKYLGISSKATDSDKLDGNDSSYFYPASNPNGYTNNTGTVIGSGLTADTFVVGNGTVNVKTSTMKPTTSSTTWSTTSDVNVPTMKAISSYVTGLGYTSNTGTVTSVGAGTGLSISGTASVNPTVNIASGYKLPTTTEWNGKATDSAVVHKADNETITGTKTFTSSDGIKVADAQSAVTYGLTYIGKGPVNNPPALIYHFPETSGTLALTSDIPSVSNATITIKQTGISDQTFTLNGSATTITLVDTNTWRPVGTGATDAAAGNHAHGNITNTGTITSTAVTSATGFLVYDSNNKIQRATSANARTILGAGTYSKPSGGIPASDLAETYYLASNPNGYTSVTESTVSGWGFTKNAGTVTSVDSVSPSSGNVALSAVRYVSQTLTDAQKTQARSNIGAGTSSFSGNYNDLTNKPTIPATNVIPATTTANKVLVSTTTSGTAK